LYVAPAAWSFNEILDCPEKKEKKKTTTIVASIMTMSREQKFIGGRMGERKLQATNWACLEWFQRSECYRESSDSLT
jgi:hypothetical protein